MHFRNPNRIRERLRRGTDPERDLAMLGVKRWQSGILEELGPRAIRGTAMDSFSGGSKPGWRTANNQAEAMKRLKDAAFSDIMVLLPLASKTIHEGPHLRGGRRQ